MKRYIGLAVIGAALMGCELEDGGGAAQPSPLDEAMEHVEAASAGHVGDADFEGTLDEYQAAELDKARAALDEAIAGGLGQLSDVQLAVAAQAMASVEAETARRLIAEALAAWSQATERSMRPMPVFIEMARLHALADNYGDSDRTAPLTKTNIDRSEARDALDKHESEQVKPLRDEIASLTARIKELRQQQQTLSREAADLLSRAVDASGQKRLDLYEASITKTEQADARAGQIDLAENRLRSLRSQLAIEELQSKRIAQRIKVFDEIIDNLAGSQTQLRNEASEARDEAVQVQGQLRELLTGQAEHHAQEIAARFDQAATHLRDAVEVLSTARNRVGGDARARLTMAMAAKQAALGQALRQAAVIDRAYASTLSMIGGWASENLPSTNSARQPLMQMADSAEQRVGEVTGRAIEALQNAAEGLGEAEDVLRDRAAQREVLTMLVEVYQSLVALPTESSYEGELSEARDRLGRLEE